jgi:hypothetical protein
VMFIPLVPGQVAQVSVFHGGLLRDGFNWRVG